MNRLWAFGDSMTAPIGSDGPYTNWLGREAKTYCDFVAEYMKMESKNKGIAGSSPNQIFDEFLKSHNEIKSGDIVIFGWSPIMRYRLASKTKDRGIHWRQIWASGWNGGVESACLDGTHVTEEVAQHLVLNRYEFSDLYSEEVNRWIYFIKEWGILKNVKIINWSWCDETFGGKHSIILDIPNKRRTDMTEETSGIVKDGHYGEAGHKELADEIIDFLNKKL